MKRILLALFAFAFSANAQSTRLCKGFMPENKMYIPVVNGPAASIEKAKFDGVLDKIETLYKPIISKKGGTFKVVRNWNDGTVNAYADRSGRTWSIHMFGGMARHPAVTEDAFAAVACHEVGHHLGGAPHFGADWASIEGQSDYFAFTKCLRMMFEKDDNKKIVQGMTVDPEAEKRCKANWSSQQDEYLCIRATMANLALGLVLVEDTGKPNPKLDTPDSTQVTTTNGDHPEAQCRVDTMLQASLCTVPFSEELGDRDYRIGACVDYLKDGSRSRCWFKPD